MNSMITLALGAIAGVATAWLLFKKQLEVRSAGFAKAENQLRELEKQLHLNETAFLANKNEAEQAHLEREKEVKTAAYRDGYDHGMTEGLKDRMVEISNLKADFREEIRNAQDEASERAKAEIKRDYETRAAIFSVRIDPYVKIENDDGFWTATHSTYTGYQYQLLINGIPAFQPHVIIQQTEELKEVKQERVDQLIQIAHRLAETAVQTYLGAAPEKAIVRGSEVVKRVTKGKTDGVVSA